MTRTLAGVAVAGLALASLGGCHAKPTPVERLPDPALRTIAEDYRRTVQGLHDRPGETWHHDWTGNILPNTLGALGSGDRGLCYEWQAEVWKGVQPSLRATGWEGVGLAANTNHWTEHHVVVVFDPRRTRRDDLLRPPTPIAWVLDPWHTGQADVYTLVDWLKTGTAEWYSVELEDLK